MNEAQSLRSVALKLKCMWLLLLLFKCEFVPDTNPSNSTGHTSDTCRVPKDWHGSFDVGIKNMVWNVRGELSRRLTSTPFSWPSSCAIRVLICKEAINLGEKEANRPQMWGPEPL